MAAQTYNPLAVLMTFNSIPITGFVKGTMIKVEYNEKRFKQKVGGQGEVARSMLLDFTGKVTFTLLATSPTNDLLSAMHLLDVASNAGFGGFFLKELNGTTIATDTTSYVEQLPPVEYSGEEVGQREWVLLCEHLAMNVGGVV
jgi:hypothetical protein